MQMKKICQQNDDDDDAHIREHTNPSQYNYWIRELNEWTDGMT